LLNFIIHNNSDERKNDGEKWCIHACIARSPCDQASYPYARTTAFSVTSRTRQVLQKKSHRSKTDTHASPTTLVVLVVLSGAEDGKKAWLVP
jgi:hypothetical protein